MKAGFNKAMIKPIDYWEGKIQSMPLQAETKSLLISIIRKEYPNGLPVDIMNKMMGDSDFSAFMKDISNPRIYSGQMPTPFSMHISDLFK